MLNGRFTLYEGENFEIDFVFMDSSGNSITWEGTRIKFSKPQERYH